MTALPSPGSNLAAVGSGASKKLRAYRPLADAEAARASAASARARRPRGVSSSAELVENSEASFQCLSRRLARLGGQLDSRCAEAVDKTAAPRLFSARSAHAVFGDASHTSGSRLAQACGSTRTRQPPSSRVIDSNDGCARSTVTDDHNTGVGVHARVADERLHRIGRNRSSDAAERTDSAAHEAVRRSDGRGRQERIVGGCAVQATS